MSDEYADDEEYTMEEHYGEQLQKEPEEEKSSSTIMHIQTPIGPVSFDIKQYDDVQKAVAATHKKGPQTPLAEQLMNSFIGSKHKRDSRYWSGKLGVFMKLHFDTYLEEEFKVTEEFMIDQGKIRAPMYETIEVQEENRLRYLAIGTRFYQSKTNPEFQFITVSTVDHDGDHRLSVYTPSEKTVLVNGKDADDLIAQVESNFYEYGILKGEFFDLRYNLIARDKRIDALIAWDENVK